MECYNRHSNEGQNALMYRAFTYWDVENQKIYVFDSEKEMQNYKQIIGYYDKNK